MTTKRQFFDILYGIGNDGVEPGLPPDAIVHPKPDSWPTFHGDYSGTPLQPAQGDQCRGRP